MASQLDKNTEALNALLKEASALPEAGTGSADAVLYTPQELTAEQKKQARSNIGAASETELDAAVEDALEQAKESGEFKGEKGDPGPQGPQGEKGEKGDEGSPGANGDDGKSATHSWNGTTLTITSASGTSSADLKGEKGDKGEPGTQGPTGEAGYTPVKGTDYWTEDDRRQMVNDVITALPNNGALALELDGLTNTTVSVPEGYTSGGTVSLTDDIERLLASI